MRLLEIKRQHRGWWRWVLCSYSPIIKELLHSS